jgi:TetR/AcrR family transcriptional regulator, transcriptional repressor for nem operon
VGVNVDAIEKPRRISERTSLAEIDTTSALSCVSQVTHSIVEKRPGKRERLVAGAGDLLHQQGVQGTTLAQIAHAADVPPGNVYYYFKTRDDLVRAVIDSRAQSIRSLLASFDRRTTPRARLKGLARSWADVAELVAAHGCPLGSLSSELNKQDDELAQEAAQLFRLVIEWAEKQFREMGRRDARDLAITLFAGVQGAALLANTLADPKILSREVRRLERWIDSIE